MSMDLYVYVGPYLEVEGKDLSIRDKFDSLVYDLRGECATDDASIYLGPNQDLPGIARQMLFSRFEETPAMVLCRPEQSRELAQFCILAAPVIDALRKQGRLCRPVWGVVCGYR